MMDFKQECDEHSFVCSREDREERDGPVGKGPIRRGQGSQWSCQDLL